MGTESSNGNTTVGPAEFPMGSQFQGANSNGGDPFGDKSSRSVPDSGANLAMGLSERMTITETPDQLGEGRNVSNGKPSGPQRGKVNNRGADDPLIWG